MPTFELMKMLRRKPASQPQLETDAGLPLPTFCIVTPVFNGAKYIDDTIQSVLSQAGDFVLHYHVQDGGSTDDTMDRVARWMKLSEQLPPVSRKVVFTCSSEPDTGMYDAINKGFARALPPGDDVVMGWIAADDRVAPGACATMAGIRAAFPDVRFLGGRISLLGETGSIIGVHPIYPFSRRCMAAGLYDGRSLPFVMQEGSFWCADLWRKVGGLDTTYRLAGDWDLWRRMAAHEPYIVADTILGFHRRRAGQLSEQMDKYYDEVDRALAVAAPAVLPEVLATPARTDGAEDDAAPTLRAIHHCIEAEYRIIQADGPRFRASAHAATVVRFNLDRKLWERTPGFGSVAVAPELVSVGGTTDSKVILFTSGVLAPEGPFPEFGMPSPIQWMDGPLAEGEVEIDQPGQYRIVLRCRSWTRNQSAVILVGGKPVGRLAIDPHGHDRDIELSVTATFGIGRHAVAIKVEQPSAGDRYLLLIDAVAEQLPAERPGRILPAPVRPIALASRAGTPPHDAWPTISIVVPTRNQGNFIRDTLDSIIRQGYPNLEIIVVDGQSNDATSVILREYVQHLTYLISEPDRGQSEAINKGFRAASGEILSWLNSDDLLAEGALHAVAHAFMTSDVDLVAGVCEVFDDTNVTTHAHLPCVPDGALPLDDLLDLENKWLRGEFFHQPEVFFRRRIWNLAGGAVDERLFYSMDYDLWVRMARHGATIRVIGSTIAHFRTHHAQKTSTTEAYRPELTAHATEIRESLGLPAMPSAKPVKHRLKIVIFNDYGFKYGAGLAHRRIGMALAAAGHDVTALAYADFDYGPLKTALSAADVAEAIEALSPDLVLLGNLHAIAADFDLLGALLPSGIPTIFYAHDQWIATGRCSYPGACTRFMTLCDAACPTAERFPPLPRDAVAPAFLRKREALAAAPEHRFAILTNSRYMRGFLNAALPSSGSPPVHVAPIGIDTNVFDLGNGWHARMVLDLPRDRFIIATAAANLADERKGLSVLLRALELIEDRQDILLLIMGYGDALPDAPVEVRQTGYLHDEDVVALNYQATDLFVGPSLAEAFGQTYIEAGACGVPAIAFDVGGVSDAILSGTTGLLVEPNSAEALIHAIVRLRADTALRRQMGIQARLHVRNTFSIAASAAKLTAILVGENALGLPLAPTVVFPQDAANSLHTEYLVEPLDAPEHGPLLWLPGRNMIEETHTPEPGGIAARFWWATWPECHLLVRGEEDGQHILKMMVRCHLPDQQITVSINRGPARTITLRDSELDILQSVQIPVELVKGLNRVDLGFTIFAQEETGSRRKLALLVETVTVLPGILGRSDVPQDGAYELLAGFDEAEGPYPEWNLPDRFHWALGRQSKVRIYSAVSGKRHWELRLRNTRRDQRLVVRVGTTVVFADKLGARSVRVPIMLRFTTHLEAGFHTVTFETTQQSQSDSDLRRMAFLFEGLHLANPAENVPLVDGVRWDQSDGFGAEMSPAVPGNRPARWIETREPTLVYEASEPGFAIINIDYRSPMSGQSALLSVNGEKCRPLDLRPGYGKSASSIRRQILLKRGQNFLDFEFLHAMPAPDEGSHEVVALVEDISVRPFTEADHDLLIDPACLTYECAQGFSAVEEALPQYALPNAFRWAMDEESVIRFNEPATVLKLRLRNNLAGQILDLSGDAGERVATVALEADLALLQEVDVALGASGSTSLVLRPRLVASGSPDDPRRRTFILESVANEDGETIQASD